MKIKRRDEGLSGMQEEGSGAHENAPVAPAQELHSSKKLKRIIEKAEKRGIVYVSRLPPHMARSGCIFIIIFVHC